MPVIQSEPAAEATAEPTYQVTWTVIEDHVIELSASELAEILGVSVEEVLAANEALLVGDVGVGLADGLGSVEGAGTYDGVTQRDNIEVGVLAVAERDAQLQPAL